MPRKYPDRSTVRVRKTPKFENPPVVETVLGVQFPEMEGFRAAHFGLYWGTLRDRYPTVSDQPRLEPVSERFPRPPIIPSPRFELLQRIPTGRVWLTAVSGSELIQLQPDRFLFNWRRRTPEAPYPSYETNSETFFTEFESFKAFCREQRLTEPVPEMCEVTYLNHIDPRPDETALDLAGRVFTGLRWEGTDRFLATPESFTFNRAFVITDNGKPFGRLYAEASIALRRDDGHALREFILFKLTARVNHPQNEGTDLIHSMQQAHDWVVCGFADLTEKHIQTDRWRRTV